jgi:cytochrome c peroxidase
LARFTGELLEVDVSRIREKNVTPSIQRIALQGMVAQKTRRLGQVLYFADVGRSAMSCDACHLEGHTEGVFFEKTHPLRIYRAPTVRGSRETPPYFTPASTFSLAQTAQDVGSRNRFHRPDLTAYEIEALASYSATITTLPNPYLDSATGAPPSKLALPDGTVGHPAAGESLFFGKAACAQCHPPPHFTLDQNPATRGQYLNVGTPQALPIRLQWQEASVSKFAIPSLVGAWDVFPFFTSGSAGFRVEGDAQLAVEAPFALRVAVERHAPTHGRADLLSSDEKNDLLAYLMTL